MSIPEAQQWGYSVMATSQRVILRSPLKQPHAEVTMVDDVPVETIQVSLFFRQKLMLVMIDMSMACALNTGSFDGTRLLWNVPRFLPALVGEGAGLKSQSFSLGLDGSLLDEATAASKGLSLVHQEGMIEIGVPFGSEGGFRKSLVLENLYQEFYTVLLMYEHVFSLIFDDGHSIDTKHRTFKVLETPLVCRQPFCLNQTIGDQEFTVYLGNIPADVLLEEIWINGQRLLILGKPQRGLSISPVVHANGSQAYQLRLPFDDPVVQWTNMGGGVVEYSIDLNVTLTIVPQRESYYYQNVITARVFNEFPPEITAQCYDGGISFSIARQSRSLWEVGVGHEPLTEQLVAQRGYRLHNDSIRTILDIPVFSIGYTYEDINLSNFYATFKLLLRDSKTLEVQASTSKRCLYRTQNMIVCSADGTMTVVATPTSTWPMVKPERTSLLDPTCKPKQADGSKVLFEFKVNSCGTRATVGEWYMVYENEIVHDRLLIADGPNFISREPQFKVTVRCFYPMSAVNRISVDQTFSSATPGFGSMRVFESKRADSNKKCQQSESINAPSSTLRLQPSAVGTLPRPGNSQFIPVSGGQKQLLSSLNKDHSSETPILQVPQFYPLTDVEDPSAPPESSEGQARETPGPGGEYSPSGPFDRISHRPISENQGSSSSLFGSRVWDKMDQGQSIIDESEILHQSLPSDLLFGMADSKKPNFNLYWSPGAGMEVDEVNNPVYQHQYHNRPTQTTHYPTLVQPQEHIGNYFFQTGKEKTLDPAAGRTEVPEQSDLLQEFFYGKQTSAPIQEVPNVQRVGQVETNLQSRGQSIRVKPPSKFVSSGLRLNQKPIIQQINSKNLNLAQYGVTLLSGEANT
ncbi:PREDICTED: uncharacterized protein LOC107098155 [Cyprinodon variegatus]|uniref:uncharacterized protein LOC107098155 n=1 Tax=Cyprinodon variegatus TaxID=28743 RepID=UPI000742B05C|nr:PREDICTED: uncharacterized protein LOC107098155 [Cyprinodon variegatus]